MVQNSHVWFVRSEMASNKRLVFISASQLVREYKQVPADRMKDAVFFFGSKRSWIFPSNLAERAESAEQPTNYLGFPTEFKELILAKEKQGIEALV